MNQKDNPHKAWAQGRKVSMKRRCDEHDYLDCGIYMITLTVEGRQPLLGTLAGHADATEGPDVPHVVLSPLGERVRECWFDISQHYPQIEVMRLCVMPDHVHGVLFVHERTERHLGHIINSFKTGTRKAARELGVIAAALPQPTQPTATTAAPGPTTAAAALPQPTQPTATTAPPSPATAPPVRYAAAMPQQKPSSHPAVGTLWEPGYNDRILRQRGQLHRMLAYLDDNPRRLLLKREHPAFFSRLGTLTVAGVEVQAMGNAALLQCPTRLQVQCSRHLYPWDIAQQQQQFLDAGRRGAVIVSPCISPGERQIATACMSAGVPLIVLLVKGFPPFFKPQPQYLRACAEGRLLLLSPYPWQNAKLTDMRKRCLRLNALAAAICQQS